MAGDPIDSRLPYRIGCPSLPVLPVQTKMLPNHDMKAYIPNFGDQVVGIRSILESHGIHMKTMILAYRLNYGVDIDDRFITVLLLSDFEPNCTDRWINAVKEVRKKLVRSGIRFTIELMADQVSAGLHTSPILSTDRAIIEGWKVIRPSFLRTVQDRDWTAIDVLYREFPLRKERPTIIIGARDANEDIWWDKTLPTLHQLLRANKVELDIVLLFLRDIHRVAEYRTEADAAMMEDCYDNTIYMGSSCAVSGSQSTGTLGGRIKLQDGASVLELGLSNYHVVKNAFTEQGASDGSFPPLSRPQSYQVAVCPSDSDHEAAVKAMKYALGETEKRHEGLSQMLEYMTEDDPSWKIKSHHKDRALRALEDLRDRLQVAGTFSRRIGCVYAASGDRYCDNPRYQLDSGKNWALNWGLIQVDRPRDISCELQKVPENAGYIRDGAKAMRYGTISADENYEVIKRGRTTGWTRGLISAVPSTLRLQDCHLPEGRAPTNQKIKCKDKYGKTEVFCHTIVGQAGEYLQPGDSGSLILLNESSNIPGAVIVGLGFAGNHESLASYMQPMDLVVEDIERVTGGKVLEPQNAGVVEVAGVGQGEG